MTVMMLVEVVDGNQREGEGKLLSVVFFDLQGKWDDTVFALSVLGF